MITLLQYNGSTITPTDDAYFYDKMVNDSGIFEGVTVTSQGGNILNISDGRGIILGRNFVVEEQTVNATLPGSASVTGRLLIQIDMSATDAPISFVTQAASPLPTLVQEDINAGGTIYQLPIATYTAEPTLISNLKNIAHKVISNATEISTLQLTASGWSGAESPYTQSVSIPSATEYSKVDIQMDYTAIDIMLDSGTAAIYISNTNGALTAYAVGEKPISDMNVQVTISSSIKSGKDPPKNSASGKIELHSELTGQSVKPVESESKSGIAFSNSAMVDKVSPKNGECKRVADIRTDASPESASCVESSARQLAVIESEANGVGVTVNKQEPKEHIEITKPSPNGTEIILNPNKTGEKFDLFQSVPTGHDVVLNPILFAEGLALALPVPPGTAAIVNKITGSESVKLVQPIPTGDDVLLMNGSAAHSASVKNSGKASIGDCVGGKSDGAVSAKNSAIPETLSSVSASQMSALKAVSDMQPQQIGLVDMLSILGMKMLWKAEAAAVIPWEYPVQNGDVLSVTQVYSAIQNDAVLEVT